jgi:hypothetical protein
MFLRILATQVLVAIQILQEVNMELRYHLLISIHFRDIFIRCDGSQDIREVFNNMHLRAHACSVYMLVSLLSCRRTRK